MSRLNIAPTRSNLIRIKRELAFASEGFEILDRKREALTTELMHLAHDTNILQDQVWESLGNAYHALENARLTVGQERVEWASLAINKSTEVEIKNRSVMGVPIPVVNAHGEPPEISYSLGDTLATLDDAECKFREVLNDIPKLAEVITTIWRLARELRKTNRRVNALKYIFIPEYEETVTFIENALEEREREETFRLKLLKNKTDQKPFNRASLEKL